MFFNLAWRNSKRSRNENLIYFLTMVTAVAAFYIVLSLGAQDVIRFLSSLTGKPPVSTAMECER